MPPSGACSVEVVAVPTVTFRAKVQEVGVVGRDGVWWRYVEVPRELKWSHLGPRESWDALPAARVWRNSDMFPRMVGGWVRRAVGLSRDASFRVHLMRDGESVALPVGVSVDESGFLATVRIEVCEEHTVRGGGRDA